MHPARPLLLLLLAVVVTTSSALAQAAKPATAVQAKTGAAAAGPQTIGRVTSVRPLPNGVEVRAGAAVVRVTAMTDSVVRVRAALNGNFAPDQSWAVVPEAAKSAREVRVQDGAQAVEFSAGGGRVRIDKASGRIAFLDSKGTVISEDKRGWPAVWHGQAFQVWKSAPEDERYFGLGERGGPLNLRERAFTNWNTDAFGWQESTDPLYKSVPFFIGLRGGAAYGIFLDNTWRSYFDFGKQMRDGISFGSDGGELNYYFIYGPHPKKVIEHYTWLTGRTPLPALYTLGYQQCRYSYFPEARVREVAQTFRERKIPVDVIYLDIDYQKENRPFTFDREKFPNAEDMINDLHAMNFRVIAITDLHLWKGPDYKPYAEGVAGDHFLKNPDGSTYVGVVWPGESVFPEFTLARSREWWGTLYADFVKMGIDGFWNDMNEPAIFQRADKTMPLETRHRLEDGRTTTHREIHNVFGMQNVRATYEGMLRLRPDMRPFVLTRAAYAGTQRYAATWTGDNTSSWNHMRQSLPSLMNLGVSGYANVGVDIGGFWGNPSPEVLTRWIQLGAFNPIFRNHTEKGSADQEPWVHGPEHEAIRKRYIELRYRLLPYTYTAFEENTRTGVPVMRPLFLEYPEQDNIATNSDVFLYGRDLLVAPMVWEMLPTYNVALPKGAWYSYWSGARIEGGRNIQLTPGLEELPVYVRAGAIIPQQPVVQSTAEIPQGPLELRVYPGPDCSGSLYTDDGISFAYRRGEFLRVSYTCEATGDAVRVRAQQQGTFTPWWKQVQVTVFGAERAPRSVTAGGQAVTGATHDASNGSVSFTIPAAAAEVVVQY